MKIAIPTRNNRVDEHFGHCEKFTIFEISDDKKVVASEEYYTPPGCGCKTDLAIILKNKGVNIMLAGNMGQGAVQKITGAGIGVFRGCSGDAKQLVEAYLNEEIIDSGRICEQHQHIHHHHHSRSSGEGVK